MNLDLFSNYDHQTRKEYNDGLFYIPWSVINLRLAQVAKLLSGMVVISATCMYDKQAIRYVAKSPRFDRVKPGAAPALYFVLEDELDLKLVRYDGCQHRVVITVEGAQ